MLIQNAAGMIAFVTSFIGLLPQVYKAFKTRSTQDLSTVMLINYLICSFAWIVYGLYISSWFVLFSNVIGALTSLVLMAQKNYYDAKSPLLSAAS